MTTSGDSATSSPQQLFDAATALAEENNLWEAALTLMQGFEELGDKADAPQLSLIHISEPTRLSLVSRMPSSD